MKKENKSKFLKVINKIFFAIMIFISFSHVAKAANSNYASLECTNEEESIVCNIKVTVADDVKVIGVQGNIEVSSNLTIISEEKSNVWSGGSIDNHKILLYDMDNPKSGSIDIASITMNVKDSSSLTGKIKVTGLFLSDEGLNKITIDDIEKTIDLSNYTNGNITTGISLNNDKITLSTNASYQLIATISPNNAADKSVTWTSSDNNVAVVDSEGIVTAINSGTATITAKTVDGYTATCIVTVELSNQDKNAKLKVECTTEETNAVCSIKAMVASGIKVVGVQGNIEVSSNLTIISEEKSNVWSGGSIENHKILLYDMDNPKIGEIDIGTVKINSKESNDTTGKVKITELILADENMNKITSEDVETSVEAKALEKNITVTNITLNKNTLALLVNESHQLISTITPNNATNKNVTWTSSDSNVATVDEEGNVTAKKSGTTTITVTTEDGNKTAQCIVTVTEPVINVTKVELNKTNLELNVGASEKLSLTITPSDATNKNVTWTSSNEEVATVNNGEVTGVSSGTATITVASQENPAIKAQINVTVTDDNEPSNTTQPTTQGSCKIKNIDRLVGDINCDGKITDTDAMIVIRHCWPIRFKGKGNRKNIITNPDTLAIMDTNMDGKITFTDATNIFMYNHGKKLNKLCNTTKCTQK